MKRFIHDTSLKLALPPLVDAVSFQLEKYFSVLRSINADRLYPRTDEERELKALTFVFGGFLASRDERVFDLRSPEVQKAIAIKERLFPFGRPKLFLCVDGRVLAKLVAGLHGNALRLPAGDSKEFVPRRLDGHLALPDGSMVADIIRDAYVKTDDLFEVLDSHVGCAARGLEEADRTGAERADKGLYEDVLRKKEMKRALVDFVERVYGDTKSMHVIQTSFDPHSGYCFIGLDQCLEDERIKKDGFTEKHLEALVREGTILSTHHLVEEENIPEIHKAFTDYSFDLDYERHYRMSTLRFWEAIEAMSPLVIGTIEHKLVPIYQRYEKAEYRAERRQTALFLLANAFTAYLNNQKHGYLYGEHDESIIAVTLSEKGPFFLARSFSVDPTNPALSGSIKFTADLIRANRKADRMSFPEHEYARTLYPSLDEYAQSPVPAVFFERIAILHGDIQQVRKADWSDIATLPWMTMTEEEFALYLESKIPDITQTTARAISRLRSRATALYTPGLPATDALLEGRIVPLWVLAGPHRETLALFPFITAGYDV